jgi:hypothetical protein
MEEPHLSPIEWLPIYLRASGSSRSDESISVKEYQRTVLGKLDLSFLKLSDMFLVNSVEKQHLLAHISDDIQIAKVKLLRIMRGPRHIDINRPRVHNRHHKPAPHHLRKNIVFVGTGNLQMNYQAMKYFDRNLIEDIVRGIPGTICDVYGKNWYRVRHDLIHKDKFRFLGDFSIDELASRLDSYVVFVFPIEVVSIGMNPYPLLAFERGLPMVVTQLGAHGLCDKCSDLHLHEPTAFETDTFQSLPFLVATNMDTFNFVQKVKDLHYDAQLWSNYSSRALAHSKNVWFSRYQAALDLDRYIQLSLQN